MTTPKKIDDGGSVTADIISERYVAGLGMLEEKVKSVGGLSLRDYFAAAALQGIWTNLHCTPTVKFNEIATRAYQQADAMIEARKEGA